MAAPVAAVLQWNCRSATSNKDDLIRLLHLHSISIAAVSETWFKPSQLFKVSGYHCLRDDRIDGKGGAALLIKNSLSFSPISIKPPNSPFQLVAATVSDITFVSLYIPPSTPFDLPLWVHMLSKIPSPLVILGDFNAHSPLWGSSSSDPSGNKLIDLMDSLNICLLNDGSPTRISHPGQSPSAVDITFCSPSIYPLSSWRTSLDPCGSDHYPIILNLAQRLHSNHYKNKSKFIIKKADWSHFRDSIQDHTISLPSPTSDNCTSSYKSWTDSILKSADKSIPKSSPVVTKARSPPWWDEECLRVLKERKAANKLYCQQMTLENYLKAKNAQAVAKRTFRFKKKNSWRNFCTNISPATPAGEVWSMIRRFRSSFSLPKATHNSAIWISDFINKIAPSYVPNIDEVPTLTPNSLNPSSWLDSPFSLDELKRATENLKDSAPGKDEILNIFIRHTDVNSLSYFLSLINIFLDSGIIPPDWKIQNIIPIFKSGKDPSLGSSYRPIALSSTLCKVAERMIKNRLDWFVEKNQILSPSQFGFRKGKSTLDNLSSLVSDVKLALSKNEYCVAVFLDICGAYDNVNIPILKKKLLAIGIPPKLVQFIINLLSQRTIFVDGSESPPHIRHIFKGLPQGSVLSPILYNIYTYDLEKSIHFMCKILQYADDLTFYKISSNLFIAVSAINNALKKLLAFLNSNGLELSPSKSKVVIFTRRRKLPDIQVRFGDEVIPISKEVKFLGMFLDSKLTWNSHINHVITKCESNINPLRFLSGVWWGSHPTSLKLLYNALIRSHLDYGSCLFDPMSSSNSHKLDKIQSKCLRLILGAMKSSPINSMQVECCEPPLNLRRRCLAEKYIFKTCSITSHPLIPILQSLKYEVNVNPFWKKHPPPLLYDCFNSFLDISTISYRNESLPLYSCPYESLTFYPKVHQFIGISKKNIKNSAQLNNAEFNKIIENNWPNYIKIFTDGSKLSLDSYCGASVYVPHRKLCFPHKLPKECSIFSAECIAIIEALQLVKSLNIRNALILSDSLSSLQKISASPLNSSSDSLICSIRALLHSMSLAHVSVVLAWIPGHLGIVGNDMADSIAKESTVHGPLSNIPIPIRDYFPILKSKYRLQWSSEWKSSSLIKGHQYSLIQPSIPIKPWFHKYTSMPKKYISSITRMRLGHTCCLSHLARFHIVRSPYCDCGSEDTLDHIFFECPINDQFPNFTNELVKLEIEFPTSVPCLLSLNTPEIHYLLAKFIYKNGLNI